MDFETIKEWFTLENIMYLIQEYRSFGPLPGIILPMIEAFLPFLPLFIFVMANASAFGLWLGFLYSWIGSWIGAMLLFMLIRKFGQKRVFSFLSRHPKVQKLMNWVDEHGFGPLFLLLCFPFTPSVVVNVVAALSRISIYQYMLAVSIGKMVMIFTISFVGYDLRSLVTQPYRTAIVFLVIFILWYVGKRIEVRLNKSMEKADNEKIDRRKKVEKRRNGINED